MKVILVLSDVLFAIASSSVVEAKGCIKGAVVGGVAGHMAGHHGKLGAVAGCAIGHHEAKKSEKTKSEHAPSQK